MDAGLARYFRDNAARQLRKANSKVDVDQLGWYCFHFSDHLYIDYESKSGCRTRFSTFDINSDYFIALVTTTLKLAEKSKLIYEEQPNYTKEELLADIGGALGLILGLNLLDVLVFFGSCTKLFVVISQQGYYSLKEGLICR